jgi:hypothetical protein
VLFCGRPHYDKIYGERLRKDGSMTEIEKMRREQLQKECRNITGNFEEIGFSFLNIDNPVEHLGLKKFEDFISSNENAVINLRNIFLNLRDKKLNLRNKKIILRIKIVSVYNSLERLHLVGLYALFFKMTRRLMLSLLAKKNPSLFIFNLYKLGVFCNA